MSLSRVSGVARIHPVHLRRSFVLQAFGVYDPTARWDGDQLTKAFAVEGGVCTVSIRRGSEGLSMEAIGAGADRVVAELVASAEADDGYHAFEPAHDGVARVHWEQAGLRLIRVPWLYDIACSAVLQQRVRTLDAVRAWGKIANRFGEKTAQGWTAFPPAAVLATVPLHALLDIGIDHRRARTLLAMARELRLHPLRAGLTREQIRQRLDRIPGVGPWTIGMILGYGAGDPDAVPVGDLHLPGIVTYALAAEPFGTDERMLELLEPFRPQRFRVVRLLSAAAISAPG